jgi:hypothetical protein
VTGSDPAGHRRPRLRDRETYSVGNAEVVAVPVDDQAALPDLRADTRGFLRKSGIDIGESEVLYVQEACRDPSVALTNLLVIRKICTLNGGPKISIVFFI